MEKEKLTTAERILNDHLWMGTKPSESQQTILSAMQEYKELHTAPLQARIDELEEHANLQIKEHRKRTQERMIELEAENERYKKGLEGVIKLLVSCKDESFAKAVFEVTKLALKGGKNG